MPDENTTREPDIAELIADVLNHPECPPEVANGICAALCEMPLNSEAFYHATALRVMFFAEPPRCPGGKGVCGEEGQRPRRPTDV